MVGIIDKELIYCCKGCGALISDTLIGAHRCKECKCRDFTWIYNDEIEGSLWIWGERRENILMRIRDWLKGCKRYEGRDNRGRGGVNLLL